MSVGVSGRVPEGPWDAIVILDVLYLLPSAEQHALIERCVAALAPGGRLLVKEMDMAAGWKARWNTAQETLANQTIVKAYGAEEREKERFSRVANLIAKANLRSGRLAAISMQRLHSEQVARDFEAVLARIARGRKNDETAAAA